MQGSSWYTKAEEVYREFDIKTGTLIYLPWDIRELIYEFVIEACLQELIDHCSQGPMRGEARVSERKDWTLQYLFPSDTPGRPLHSVFDLCAYNVYSRKLESSYPTIRYRYGLILLPDARYRTRGPPGLNALQNQLHKVFLSAFTFHFSCPNAFSAFIRQLNFEQQRQLRHIEIEVFNKDYRCLPKLVNWKVWLRIFDGVAPKLDSLSALNFRVSQDAISARRERSRFRYNPAKRMLPATDGFLEALQSVEVVSKMMKRRAKGVHLSLLDPHQILKDQQRIALQDVLNEVNQERGLTDSMLVDNTKTRWVSRIA